MIVILAIGNEVVSGQILNRNGQFIAEALSKRGFTVFAQNAVRDEIDTIKSAFKEAFNKADILIATGGLGPTIDDLTKEAAALYFNSGIRLDEKIKAELIERFKGKVHSVDNQAQVPDKAKIIPNPVGTAPGFIFEDKDKRLILLPGIPAEMIAMFNESVIPYLEELALPKLEIARISLFNLPESKVDPALRVLKGLEVGIYPQAGILNVILRSSDKMKLKEAEAQLKKLFEENYFESASGKIEEAVHNKLTSQKKTLSLAESVTGGALSARLTALPGSSAYYLGGVVAYSNEAKVNFLDVPEPLIVKDGAVSEPVAKAMCIGAKKRFGSDYALSVTGIAGPGGATETKPLGLVWCGIAGPNGVKTWKLEGRGNRALIIERSVNSLLAELYMQLL